MAPSLTPASWCAILTYLSARFGCDEDALRTPGAHFVKHGGELAGYHGVYVWSMLAGDRTPVAVVVSTPPALVAEALAALATTQLAAGLDPVFWRATLGDAVERVIGPSYQGYVDSAAFTPLAASPARQLGAGEQSDLERLRLACFAEEWEHSAIQPDHDPIYVVRGGDGALEAAASLTRDSAGVVAVGVITRPDARGRGHGRAVVSALTAWALAQGETVHYQTLRSNTGSVAIARSLGFQEVASALSIRLRQR